MKTYRSDKKNSDSVFLFIIWFLVIISIVFFFFRTSLQSYASNILAKNSLALNASHSQQLKQENENLHNENEELKILLRNANLTEDFINNGVIDLISANIVLPKTSIIYNNLLINKGEADGIKEGALVFSSGLLPVGKILEVYSDSSLVELYSAEGKKIDLTLGSATDTISFTAIGDGAYGFYAAVPNILETKIDQNVYLKENQNYKFGVIVDVIENINNKTKEIYIKNNFSPIKTNKLYVER